MGITLRSRATASAPPARPMPAPPDGEPLRVLLVEDRHSTARELLTGGAGRGPVQFLVDRRAEFPAALAAIRARCHDVYLIDVQLGRRCGLDLVREAFAGRAHAPVILLVDGTDDAGATGDGADGLDVEARSLGVADQLVKESLDRTSLQRSIRYALSHHRAIAELARSEERYSLAIRAANDGIWDWDLVADTLYLSARWHAILGRAAGGEPATAPGRSGETDHDPVVWFALVHPGDVLRLRAAVGAHLDGRTPHLLAEHRMRHADGSWRWVVTRGLAIRDSDGVPTRMAGSMSDVTARRAAQLRLQHDALHDNLTGLPNRTLFMDRVHQHLQRAMRDPRSTCAVLFFDVDRFKLVNDSLSHAVGDKLLVAIAGRVATALRPGDTVARLGGDEFAVLLEDLGDSADAGHVAGRILRALDLPFRIDGHELFASVSIGIALSGSGPESADLIANADIAMYSAKRRGRGRSAVFDEGMRRTIVDRLARENELRLAVEGSRLGIHFQPIVDLATGEVCGLEALSRWPQPGGAVPPSEFISIAEDTGIIGALGEQVLRRALATLSDWRREGLIADEVCMSVNLSGRQLDDPTLAEQVRTAIELAQVPPRALKLEITESTLVAEMERTQRVFAEVCSTGVGLHLDDFGTGYSSLSALHRFPVEALKIDRSFVADLVADEGSEVIVRSTVAMAHSLGLPVIAEGIETPAQLRRLRSLGCEFGQGHLFSPALSAEDTRLLLADWDPADIVSLAAAA